MPKLSDSMEKGTILNWLKDSGQAVCRGEVMVEIETDKATVIFEAESDGLLEIVVAAGETVPVGAVIAQVSEAEDTSAGSAVDTSMPASPSTETTLRSEQRPSRIKASPVARRLARTRNLDLKSVAGSGPEGRIVLADLVDVEADGASPPARELPPDSGQRSDADPSPSTTDLPPLPGENSIRKLSNSQRLIAQRTAFVKQTVPEFTLESQIDMERCAELHERLHKLLVQGESLPTYNDMIVRACALALPAYPRVNGAFKDGQFEFHSRVNIGIAVASAEALVVPTIFDADKLGLQQIAAETHRLVAGVRDGTITPRELSGGTFTVSNLGMYGIDRFTAIINPPQAAILAAGVIKPQPVAYDGGVVARRTMSVIVACDHRILYGADAAQFLAHVRALLEEPLTLLY